MFIATYFGASLYSPRMHLRASKIKKFSEEHASRWATSWLRCPPLYNIFLARTLTVLKNEKLVEAVRLFSCLWQVNTKLYKDCTKANENSHVADVGQKIIYFIFIFVVLYYIYLYCIVLYSKLLLFEPIKKKKIGLVQNLLCLIRLLFHRNKAKRSSVSSYSSSLEPFIFSSTCLIFYL